eukprot:UN03938
MMRHILSEMDHDCVLEMISGMTNNTLFASSTTATTLDMDHISHCRKTSIKLIPPYLNRRFSTVSCQFFTE